MSIYAIGIASFKEKYLRWSGQSGLITFGKPALSKDARADIWIKKNIDKVTNFNRDEFRGMTTYFYDHISKKGKVEMGAKTDEKFYKIMGQWISKIILRLLKKMKKEKIK